MEISLVKLKVACVLLICACVPASIPWAQVASTASNASQQTAFDVASVKRNLAGYPPDGPPPHSNFPLDSGDAYVPSGGLFNATNWPVYSYIGFAYKMSTAQMDALRAELPKWGTDDHFDIQARAEGNPTKDDMRTMMRGLLADRFKMTVHMETRQVPMYDLMLEKPGQTGPKLQPHSADHPCYDANGPKGQSAASSNGTSASASPALPCGTLTMRMLPAGRLQVEAHAIRLSQIADYMKPWANLDRPVRDRTGLYGMFDYIVEWAPERAVNWNGLEIQPDQAGPTFLEALKEQLGLKLVATTGPLDVLIVDHIEEPSAN